MRKGLIDGFVWKSQPKQAQRLLKSYMAGNITYRQLQIKVYYLKKTAMNGRNTRLNLEV